jgi:diguanylate cyclase (GGDEF)-like protein
MNESAHDQKRMAAGFVVMACMMVLVLWRWHQRQLDLGIRHRTAHLERENEQMRYYAEHDDLTGLWNRRMILQRLHQEVNRAQRDHTPLSVVLLDLDHFKRVNDTFGHPGGDLVLEKVSAILQNFVRSYDWVGRCGGEEFLLILPGANLLNAQTRAEQLRQTIALSEFLHDGALIQITTSLGVVCSFPAMCDGLIRTVDSALYEAKKKGRNCVVAIEMKPCERENR